MSEHENPLNGIFNQAEMSMGSEMYQAQVESIKASAEHCRADTARAEKEIEKVDAEIVAINSSVASQKGVSSAKAFLLTIPALILLSVSPAIIFGVYSFVFGG